MKEAAIFYNEKDFRAWFECNLERFGIDEIILSQEPCPDYVVKMKDGRVLKLEVELFDINFKYHGHDPSKADMILACYAKESEIIGVPVTAVHNLWVYEPDHYSKLPPEGPLSGDELRMLRTILAHSSLSLMALADGDFAGNEQLFQRVPPELVASLSGRRIDDSILNVISPEARTYIRKHYHMLIASNWSKRACSAFEMLSRRELIRIRPISFLAALYDGISTDHEGWVPCEAYPTSNVSKYHKAIVDELWTSLRSEGKNKRDVSL